jgi:hypothetical protein
MIKVRPDRIWAGLLEAQVRPDRTLAGLENLAGYPDRIRISGAPLHAIVTDTRSGKPAEWSDLRTDD